MDFNFYKNYNLLRARESTTTYALHEYEKEHHTNISGIIKKLHADNKALKNDNAKLTKQLHAALRRIYELTNNS